MPTWLNTIVSFFNDAAGFFYDLYLEAYNAAYIPYAFALLLYDIHVLMNNIAWAFYDGYQWAVTVWGKVQDILDWSTIRVLIQTYWPNLDNALAWFLDWSAYVRESIWDWWNTVEDTIRTWVQQWVDMALAGLSWLINAFNVLQSAWDDFKARIPSIDEIIDWFKRWWDKVWSFIRRQGVLIGVEINDLIDSALRQWFPFYDDLVDLWAEIKLFFVDPQQYVYDKLDEWFERFW